MSFSRRDFMSGLASLPALLGFERITALFSDPLKMSPDEIRNTHINGSFEAECGVLRPGLRGTGEALLVSRPSFSYQQAIQVWQPGHDKKKRYYTGGRTQGLAKCSRLVGPSKEVYAFLAKYKDLENKDTLRMIIPLLPSIAKTTGPQLQYRLENSVISFYGPVITVGGMTIVEDVQIMFSDLILPSGKRYDFPLAGMEGGAS